MKNILQYIANNKLTIVFFISRRFIYINQLKLTFIAGKIPTNDKGIAAEIQVFGILKCLELSIFDRLQSSAVKLDYFAQLICFGILVVNRKFFYYFTNIVLLLNWACKLIHFTRVVVHTVPL